MFFQAGGQAAVVLWSRNLLAADCGITDDATARFSGVVLAHNVRSRSEVDDVWEVAFNPDFPLSATGELVVPDFASGNSSSRSS